MVCYGLETHQTNQVPVYHWVCSQRFRQKNLRKKRAKGSCRASRAGEAQARARIMASARAASAMDDCGENLEREVADEVHPAF
jgi:hypothetical protein